ncbi:hypothetical protein PtB15_18B453 [Puccinia triticina]|nr:hypothetical protein PtB15_18B453 [Puccinia triticina]
MSDKRMHDPAEGHEKTKENLSDTSDTIVVDDIADSDDPDTLHEDSSDEMDEDSIEDSEDDMDDDSEDDSDHEISLPDDLNKALKAIKTPGTFAAWEAEFRLKDREAVRHLVHEIDQSRARCSQKVDEWISSRTVIVKKYGTLEEDVAEWKMQRKFFYQELFRDIKKEHLESLLGAEETARLRSLAELAQ